MIKVAIFGVPRSGTSWLSQIFNSHPDVVMRFQPLFSYSHKGKLSENSSGNEIDQFFDEILNSRDEFATMASATHKNYPVFMKSDSPTHIAFKETRYLNVIGNILAKSPEVKVIGLVRNPFAIISSWINAPKEFNADWNLLNEWRLAPSKNLGKKEEYFGFEKWKDSSKKFLEYEREYPVQFKLVRYGSLRESTDGIATTLFEFCGLRMQEQVSEFISLSRSIHDSDPYSVFRAKANDVDWRNTLPPTIIEAMMVDIVNEQLDEFLI